MRFMLRIYKRHTLLSRDICTRVENNSVRRRRYPKMEIENGIHLPVAPRTVAVARRCRPRREGVGGPGVPKDRPGGSPGPVSTREILGNLAFCGES
jgi:hypothetical protein